jgi:hypothetical protein
LPVGDLPRNEIQHPSDHKAYADKLQKHSAGIPEPFFGIAIAENTKASRNKQSK